MLLDSLKAHFCFALEGENNIPHAEILASAAEIYINRHGTDSFKSLTLRLSRDKNSQMYQAFSIIVSYINEGHLGA